MDNKLTRNPETGYYEGTIRIQVDPEIFKRILLKEIEDDETVDLTNPETWNKITDRISKVSFWVDRPHTRVTEPLKVIEAPKPKSRPRKAIIEERFRVEAYDVSPYSWEEKLLSPLPSLGLPDKERQLIHQLRYDERQVIKKLREEYDKGNFTLSEEAEKEEQEWRQSKNTKLSVQVETLQTLVNGSKIH